MATTTQQDEPKKRGRRSGYTVSQDHKDKLARGREIARDVNAFLVALEANRPKRGRKVSIADLQKRWEEAQATAAEAVGTAKLLALQAVEDLQARVDAELSEEGSVRMAELQKKFVESAKEYGEVHNVSYSTWRSIGVEPELLRKAGIPRAAG